MIIAVPVIAMIKIWLNHRFSSEISEFDNAQILNEKLQSEPKITRTKKIEK